MEKKVSILLLLLLIFGCIDVHASQVSTYNIYVSVTGSDTSGDGSFENPYATISAARNFIRSIKDDINTDICVYLRGGTYRIAKSIEFNLTDSAPSGHKIIYSSYEGENAIISGSVKLSEFSYTKDGKIKIPVDSNAVRQLYINGEKREVSTSNLIYPQGVFKSYDGKYKGIYVDSDKISESAQADDIMLCFEKINWSNCILKAEKIEKYGKYSKIYIKNNDFDIAMLNSPSMSENSAFRIINDASSDLKEKHWYFDSKAKSIYYMPSDDEDINNAEITVPVVEKLIDCKNVNGLTFCNLTFTDCAWNDTYYNSYKPFQAGELFYRGDSAEKHGFEYLNEYSMVPSGITFTGSNNIEFKDNNVKNFGAAAIGMPQGTKNIRIEGNVISEIAESAITIGNPRRRHDINKGDYYQTENITVKNNFIHNIGTEYRGAPAIVSYSTQNSAIENNYLRELPYSGISVGWFWNNTEKTQNKLSVKYNLIESVCEELCDGAGIYTLGRLDNTVVCNNYIKRVLSPSKYSDDKQNGAVNYGLYLDQGSSMVTVCDNVIEDSQYSISNDISIQKTIKNNYSDTEDCFTTRKANSGDTQLVFDDAYLEEPKLISAKNANTVNSIKRSAGLENKYSHICDWIEDRENTPPTFNPPISEFSAGVYESIFVQSGASDDGIPYQRMTTRWEVKKAPDEAYALYPKSDEKYPRGVCIYDEFSSGGSKVSFSEPGEYILRMYVSDGEKESSHDFTFNITELDEKYKNIALNKPVTATSIYSDDYNPEYLCDGKSTEFASGIWSLGTNNVSMMIDLGKPEKISYVVLRLRDSLQQRNNNYGFIIQMSDTADFTNFKTVLGTDKSNPYPFGRVIGEKVVDTLRYRYVRIISTSYGNIMVFKELEIYSDATDNTEYGLAGYWKLNESDVLSGAEIFEEINSGAAYAWGITKNGGLGTQFSSNGAVGKAMNPSSDPTGYYVTEKVPKTVLDENGEMTIAMWVKTPENIPSWAWIWSMGEDATSNNLNYRLVCSSYEGLSWRVIIPNEESTGFQNRTITMVPAKELLTNTWYHVALKLKRNYGSDGRYFVYEAYLNGERVSVESYDKASSVGIIDYKSVGGIKTFFSDNNWRMLIGADYIRGSIAVSPFKGLIDDVRVYNVSGNLEQAKNSDGSVSWKVRFKEKSGVDIKSLYEMYGNKADVYVSGINIGNDGYLDSVILCNAGSENLIGKLIFGIYNNGELVDFCMQSFNAIASGYTEYTPKNELFLSEGDTLRIYGWDNLLSIKPISEFESYIQR